MSSDLSIHEIRFAIVLYGGLSLTVYMNGVAQELFHLVRATAVRKTAIDNVETEELLKPRGMEEVYQSLSRQLARGRKAGEAYGEGAYVRFVVDILSGTSAGGLNAVFLGKALTRNLTLDEISRFWLEEADFSKLLNDEECVKNAVGVEAPSIPKSLLSGNRAYRKVFDALEVMDAQPADNPAPNEAIPPYVRELDVYLTATDVNGLPLPIRLSDRVVQERQYRTVFKFSANREGDQDFEKQYNPFLAFAARCTSSFPVAFDVTQLKTMQDIGIGDPEASAWQKFYLEYVTPNKEEDSRRRFVGRPFADGGYLDNKPFDWALHALRERQGTVSASRKLIYVDASPDRAEAFLDRPVVPGPLANAMLAATTLPRAQTIREDVQRILERNRNIERLEVVTRFFDRQEALPLPPPVDLHEWLRQPLPRTMRQRSASFIGYYRLRLSSITDQLARWFSGLKGLDENSDYFEACRYLVRVWREDCFPMNWAGYNAWLYPMLREVAYPIVYPRYDRLIFAVLCGMGAPFALAPEPVTLNDPLGCVTRADWRTSPNLFLFAFDLDYRIRRLAFILSRLTLLGELDFDAVDELRHHHGDELEGQAELVEPVRDHDTRKLIHRLRGTPELFTKWEQLIHDTHERLAVILALLRKTRRAQGRGGAASVYQAVQNLELTAEQLIGILQPTDDNGRLQVAERLYLLERMPLRQVPRMAAIELAKTLKETGQSAEAVLTIEETGAHRALLAYLRRLYDSFDEYDSIMFPIVFGTDIGEMIPVELLRISPLDATSLIDEETDGRRKLAGTALGDFGAFVDRAWRRNDMMWGRLDAAERLITSLLPEPAEHGPLLRQAQTTILTEELTRGVDCTAGQEIVRAILATPENLSADNFKKWMRERLDQMVEAPAAVWQSQVWQQMLVEATAKNPDSTICALANSGVESVDLARKLVGLPVDGGARYSDPMLDFMNTTYEVDRRLVPATVLPILARGLRITSRLLEGARYSEAPAYRWVCGFLAALSPFAEAAVPRSFTQLFSHYLAQAIGVMGVILALGGLYAHDSNLKLVGLLAFLCPFVVTGVTGEMRQMLNPPSFPQVHAKLWSVGAIAVLATLLGWSTQVRDLAPQEKLWTKSIVIAAELMEPHDAKQVFKHTTPSGLRTSTARDFLFIVAYTWLLLELGRLIRFRGGSPFTAAGYALAVFAVAAGVSDVVENTRLLDVADLASRSPRMIPLVVYHGLHLATMTKWTCLFAASVLLSALFLRSQGNHWWNLVAAVLTCSGLIGLLSCCAINCGYQPGRAVLELAATGLFLGFPYVALQFLLFPRQFMKGFRIGSIGAPVV